MYGCVCMCVIYKCTYNVMYMYKYVYVLYTLTCLYINTNILLRALVVQVDDKIRETRERLSHILTQSKQFIITDICTASVFHEKKGKKQVSRLTVFSYIRRRFIYCEYIISLFVERGNYVMCGEFINTLQPCWSA